MKSIARSLAVEMALQQRAMGRRIAQMRERAHLTQEAAADRAGVTLRAYQKWEAGGGIQYSNLQRLAEALKTTVDQITGEAETPNPFKVSEQLDGVTSEFSLRVDHVEAKLEQIDSKLDELLALIRPRAADGDGPDLGLPALKELLEAHLAALQQTPQPVPAPRTRRAAG